MAGWPYLPPSLPGKETGDIQERARKGREKGRKRTKAEGGNGRNS